MSNVRTTLLRCRDHHVFAAACGHAPPEPAGTNHFSQLKQCPPMLTRAWARTRVPAQLTSLLFSGLMERDASMNVRGDLAERWETPDPKTYVFHLHDGVHFSDGRPLTSADVKFTFQSIMSGIPGTSGVTQSPKRGAFRVVQSIETPDALTVIFHLSEPNAAFAWSLVRSAVGIVPAGSGSDFAQHPVGSGPFRFVSSLQDEEVDFERNAAYFRGPSQIEHIRFRVVPEPVVRALELRKGTADAELNSFTPDMVPVLAKQSDLAVSEEPGTIFSYISFNCEDATLAHREVRQALTYATDRATLARTLMRDQAPA